ncbi:MAG: flagellar hook-length control protein FliK, partial [Phycisphaerales bacterium]|nr:flagellar hook-length control protein FliK [Phycisphaerales bacterium]
HTNEIRIILVYAGFLPQMMPVVFSALDVLEGDSSGGGGGANPPARTMQTKPSPTAAAETTSTPTTPTPATPTHMHSQTLVTSQSPAPVPPHPMQAQTVMPLSTQLETPPATASTSTPDGAVPQTAGTSPTAENPLPPNVSVFQERLPRSMPGNSFSPSPAGRSETTLPDGRVSDRSTRLRGVSEKTSESENPEVPTAKVVVRESSPLLVDKKSAEEVQSSQSAASRIVQLPQPDEADDLPQRAPANREKAQTFADTIKRVTKPESGETAAPSNDTKRSPTERPPAMQPVPPQAASNLIASSANASAHTANVPQEDKSASPLPSAPIPSATTLTLPVAASPNASTEGAESATPAQQLPPEQGDPTFEQVVLGLRGKLDAKNGKAEIRLDPPNLGTLHVSLRLSNGTLTAEFTSPSDVVRDLLQSHMEKLKNVLEGQGVAVDKLAVESPAPAPGAGSEANSPFADASNHDGRSAGNFGRDSQPGHRQPQQGAASQFARMFQNSLRNLATPVDVIA